MSINKNELMLRGARSRLVELDKERLEILKLFPELDTQTQAPSNAQPPVGASGRRLMKTGTAFKLWSFMTGEGVVTAGLASEKLRLSKKTVYNALTQLEKQKLAVKVGRGQFRIKAGGTPK
jgi:hypothetical protein